MKKSFIAVFFMFFSMAAWSHTFLVTTLESMDKSEMDMEIKEKIVILENGIMDSLFDSGHIFFSSHRAFDETSDVGYKQAQDSGADYILEIYYESESDLIHYFLYDAVGEKMITMETFSKEEVKSWKRGMPEDFYYSAGEYISHKVYFLI